MNPLQTRSKWSMSLGSVLIHARDGFTSSKLPTKREIVERVIWFLVPRPKGSYLSTSQDWVAQQMAEELCEHWIWCNLYPKHPKNVAKMILSIYQDFRKLKSYPKARMTEKWVKEKVEPYLENLEQGLDIRTLDVLFRKKQEDIYGVKETEDEEDFWQDQMKGKRVGHCDNFVDRRWRAQDARRKNDIESFNRRLERSEQDMIAQKEMVEVPDEYEDTNQKRAEEDHDDYEVQDQGNQEESRKKKRKVVAEASMENTGVLPVSYRHIRTSVRNVRQEYYTAIDRCISELHMSKEQAIGSTIIIAKELFNVK